MPFDPTVYLSLDAVGREAYAASIQLDFEKAKTENLKLQIHLESIQPPNASKERKQSLDSEQSNFTADVMEKAKNGDPGALAVLPLRCLWFQGKPSSNRDRVYRVGVSATGVGLGLSTVSVLAYHQSPEKVLRFFSVSQRWIGWLGLGLVLTPLVLGVSMLSLGFFVDVGCVGYDCCVSGWNNGDAKKKGATSTTTTTTKSVSLDVCCWPLVSLTSNSTFA